VRRGDVLPQLGQLSLKLRQRSQDLVRLIASSVFTKERQQWPSAPECENDAAARELERRLRGSPNEAERGCQDARSESLLVALRENGSAKDGLDT